MKKLLILAALATLAACSAKKTEAAPAAADSSATMSVDSTAK